MSWCLVLLLQSSQHRAFSIVGPSTCNGLPLEVGSRLRIMKVCSTDCLRLTCIAVAGLGASSSRFLEGALYRFLNE